MKIIIISNLKIKRVEKDKKIRRKLIINKIKI